MHRHQLEGQTARVALVGQHEIEHRRGLHHVEIAASVGDGGIAQLQRQPQPRLDPRRVLVDGEAYFGGNRLRPFQTAAEIQEQPAAAAHHVLRR